MPNSDSRWRFLFKLAALAMPFVLILICVEWRLAQFPSSYAQKRAQCSKMAPNLETILLGASEVAQGVDASAFGENCYNLANVGQTPYYDKNLLHWVSERAPKLRLAVMGLSYPSLGCHIQNTQEAWRAAAYFQEFGIPPEGGLAQMDLRDFSRTLFYEPPLALRWAMFNQGLQAPQLNSHGQDVLDCPPSDFVDIKINALTARHRAVTHEGMIREDAVNENLAELDSIWTFTQSKGIRLVLFLPPVTRSYAEAVDTSRHDRFVKLLDDFARIHSILMLNYYSDPRFQDSDFFDVDHLCDSGSRRFGRILAADIRNAK
jgi:hypothetical protein